MFIIILDSILVNIYLIFEFLHFVISGTQVKKPLSFDNNKELK